jgi:hypothetical protein
VRRSPRIAVGQLDERELIVTVVGAGTLVAET